ncbi:hypothetical protein C8F01DRAFT_1255066 [Mycena amicta]|nr:hypothetical protein C8F01DRAFT_1255066 [Mycena amicta]
MPPRVDDEQRFFTRTSAVVRASRGRQPHAASTSPTHNSGPSSPPRRLRYVGESLAVPGIFPRGSPLVSFYDSDSPPPRDADGDHPASEESDSESAVSAWSWDSDADREASEQHRRLRPPLRRVDYSTSRRAINAREFYLSDARPPPSPDTIMDAFKCSICLGLLSHPVANCYVCIRGALLRSSRCPVCTAVIDEEPYRHYAFEQAIAATYPDWIDDSEVLYTYPELLMAPLLL